MSPSTVDFEVFARHRPQHFVLFLGANVRGTLVDFGNELMAVRNEVHKIPGGHDIEFDVWPAVTLDEMKRQISRSLWDIVHFCGAGVPDGMLVGKYDEPTLVPVAPLANLFATLGKYLARERGERPVKVVILNACHSLAQAQALQPHVPCVIGVDGLVSQQTTVTFAQWFYRGIADAKNVKAAFDIAVSLTASDHDDAKQFKLLEPSSGVAAATSVVQRPR